MQYFKYTILAFLLLSTHLFAEPKLNLYEQNSDKQANSWLSDNQQEQNEFLSADEAFSLSVLQDKNSISLIWNIAEHYYLYKNSIQTKLIQNNSKTPSAILDLNLPKAQIKTDKHYGQTPVYYNQLNINLAKTEIQNSILEVSFQGCAVAGLCYPKQTKFVQFKNNNVRILDKLVADNSALVKQGQISQDTLANNADSLTNDADRFSKTLKQQNIFSILAIFFFAGLLLAFTPCILPMLPIISALVVGKNKTKRQGLNLSLAYVLGMALSYAFLGGLSGALGGVLNLQSALQSPWVVVPFALLFVILALPMFGLFELQLPSSWQAKIIQTQNNIGQKTNLLATLAIGFLAALVVSPCLSAPLAAALSFVAQTGNAGTGALALFASGLGMGVPLIIFVNLGAKFLPKSGVWMNKVKHIFGVILLAMAVYVLKTYLPANWLLVITGVLILASAGIILPSDNFAKNRLAFIAAIVIGIYALALIIGGFMGNASFKQPLNFDKAENTAQIKNSSLENVKNIDKPNVKQKSWLEISSLAELQQVLNSKDKKAVVLLSAQWCTNCKIVAMDILSDADLISASENFALIKLDITRADASLKDFLQKNYIFGPPAFLFYKYGEQQKDLKLQGIIDKNEILKRFMALNVK